jgi:2,4-dienoyl-CoA reductase-like NADH-dependent reductase (Old Yellow Enzyme family)
VTPYPHLFSPLRIGPLESGNRIVCGAHFTMFAEPSPTWGEPGFFGERYGRYLGERARGGAGVIIAGQAQVHPTTAYQMLNNAVAWDEAAMCEGCGPQAERLERVTPRSVDTIAA